MNVQFRGDALWGGWRALPAAWTLLFCWTHIAASQQQNFTRNAGQGTPPGATNELGRTPPLVGPPFPQNELEQQFVRQVLESWEAKSAEIKTFSAAFERWEYHPAWFSADKPMIQSRGRVSYSKPDQGSFRIEEIRRWKPHDPQDAANPKAPGDYQLQKDEIGEHWVVDGKAIYEYDEAHKQLKVTPLPQEMRGQAIVDGPLPFLFGAKADALQRRYWLRSPRSDAESIWLEAFPRWQSDAANYRQVDIILERKSMQPKALQVHQPNDGERHAYMFETPTINGKLEGIFGGLFKTPRAPFGWKTVVMEPPPVSAQSPDAQSLQR